MRFTFALILSCSLSLAAQSQLYYKGTLKANREKTYRNLVQHTINKNLSDSLTDETEENWQSAFNAIEVLKYQSPWINSRVDKMADQLSDRSEDFQRAALELLCSNYPGKYYQPVKLLLMQTGNSRIFAICAAYILNSSHAAEDLNFLIVKTKQQTDISAGDPVLLRLAYQLQQFNKPFKPVDLSSFFPKNYLPGHVILFSFQRKNRNYPGLVMVRDASGNFRKDSTGNYFAVPQLARSINNLPGYISNGNTPEGIFRMKGYDVSRSNFIGPTVNVQLSMPFEKSPDYFSAGYPVADSAWNISYYRRLLPDALKDYEPLYESYWAGKAGRREIIIHGTTIDPLYYRNEPYYPLTPTMGCLTSKEIWSEQTGQRIESDQQKLINAMIPAGGAQGYAIVINIDDAERPVLLYDIVPFIDKAGSK